MAHWTQDPKKERESSLQSELDTIVEARKRRRLLVMKVVSALLGLAALALLIDVVREISMAPPDGLIPGQNARVSNAVLAAVDEAAWEELLRLQSANDQVALNMLERSGRAFVVSEGATVRVLQSEYGSAFVRVESGRNQGKSGWVQPGRLVPMNNQPIP